MAITPKDAQAQAQPDEKVLRDLEARIDKAIVTALRSGTTPTFSAREINTRATRDAVINRYRFAGWDVRYHSDQRDGDYLEFRVAHYDQREARGHYLDR